MHEADPQAPPGSAARAGWTAKIERFAKTQRVWQGGKPSLLTTQGQYLDPISNGNYNNVVNVAPEGHLPVSLLW